MPLLAMTTEPTFLFTLEIDDAAIGRFLRYWGFALIFHGISMLLKTTEIIDYWDSILVW